MTTRLVVFDLGRVLVRICDNWQHACQVAGLSLPADLPKSDPAMQARLDEIVRHFDTGMIDLATFARRIAPARGLTAEQVILLSNVFLLGPYEGAGELIDDIHAAGHHTACLSNTNANHWRIMTDLSNPHGPVLTRLRHHFASHLLGVRKPDPQIYAHVERETGVPPDDIVFFDDMAENITAAQQRGWSAHLVDICDNPIPTLRERLRYDGVLP